MLKESVGDERMYEMLMIKKRVLWRKATARYILGPNVGAHLWL